MNAIIVPTLLIVSRTLAVVQRGIDAVLGVLVD